jgi:hypothetical protein
VKTLRQHVEEAERIMSICGVKTLIPQKGLPATVRVDAGNRQLEYAVSIRLVIEKHDRTGYAADFLRTSDDTAGTFWHSIPEWPVCPLCIGRIGILGPMVTRKAYCVACGAFVRPKVLRGLVSADLAAMAGNLRAGSIPVRREKGERE